MPPQQHFAKIWTHKPTWEAVS